MKNNLIIYETYYGISKKVAEAFALILGNAKVYDVKDAIKDVKSYDNIICVFAFHGYTTAEQTKKYIKSIEENIKEKTLGVVGVGLSKNDIKNYVMSIAKTISKNIDFVDFVEGELRVDKLTEDDRHTLEDFLKTQNMKLIDMGKFEIKNACKRAISVREILNTQNNSLSESDLKKSINEFINSHNTCALATSSSEFTRVTPIEYVYYEDNLYFITEGGLKFANILQNPNVAICIYDNYNNMHDLKGLQIEGKAKSVELYSDEYIKVINKRKLTVEQIKSFKVNLNLIKVTINKFEFLNSDFRKMNVDVKQYLNK